MPFLRPINATTPAQSAAIRAIRPTCDETYGSERIVIRPAAVTLIDGTVHERAYLELFARYSDAGGWTGPGQIADIRPSPYALPVPLRDKLRAAASDAGHIVYRLHFPDRPPITLVADPHYADFPCLPDSYDITQATRLTFDADPDPSTIPNAHHPRVITYEYIFHDDPRLADGR